MTCLRKPKQRPQHSRRPAWATTMEPLGTQPTLMCVAALLFYRCSAPWQNLNLLTPALWPWTARPLSYQRVPPTPPPPAKDGKLLHPALGTKIRLFALDSLVVCTRSCGCQRNLYCQASMTPELALALKSIDSIGQANVQLARGHSGLELGPTTLMQRVDDHQALGRCLLFIVLCLKSAWDDGPQRPITTS